MDRYASLEEIQQNWPPRRDKVLYIHVGKTAGTALNNYISGNYPSGRSVVHLESTYFWSDQSRTCELDNFDFISGHVSLPKITAQIQEKNFLKLATFRKPAEHVASHLAWIRHLNEPGKEAFKKGHPEWVQKLSDKFWEMDFSDCDQIKNFFQNMSHQEAGLFDNCQTRYLVDGVHGHRINNRALATALTNLEQVDVLGVAERYDELLAFLAYVMGWDVPKKISVLNSAKTKYGIDLTNPAFAEAIESVTWADSAIYQASLQLMANQFNGFFGLSSSTKSNARLVDAVGSLDIVSPNRIAGWAVWKIRPNVPLVVEVRLKSGQVLLARAKHLRPDIEQLGKYGKGNCGFIFVFSGDQALPVGEEVEVSILWSGLSWRRVCVA